MRNGFTHTIFRILTCFGSYDFFTFNFLCDTATLQDLFSRGVTTTVKTLRAAGIAVNLVFLAQNPKIRLEQEFSDAPTLFIAILWQRLAV